LNIVVLLQNELLLQIIGFWERELGHVLPQGWAVIPLYGILYIIAKTHWNDYVGIK
jgi:hypothetical protein